MNRFIVSVLAFAAVLIPAMAAGLLPGATSPSAHATTESLELRINPGPQAYNAILGCTWHTACTSNPPPFGYGLDWNNGHEDYSPNTPVYWRSWAYRSIGWTQLGTAAIFQNNGNCKDTYASVTDAFGFGKGAVVYTHTNAYTAGGGIIIPASPSWSYKNQRVGSSVTSEFSYCAWDGQHLRQTADTTMYSSATSNFLTTGGGYNVDSSGNWQQRQSWQWNY